MQARKQLNGFYFFGCVLVAMGIGIVMQSWLALFGALAVSILICIQAGAIRIQRPPRYRHGVPARHPRKRESP